MNNRPSNSAEQPPPDWQVERFDGEELGPEDSARLRAARVLGDITQPIAVDPSSLIDPLAQEKPHIGQRLARWWGFNQSHSLTTWLFLRGLAVVYLIAFVSMAVQVEGLVGSRGILPVADFHAERLAEAAANNTSQFELILSDLSLTWINQSDAFLLFICLGGVVIALLLLFDILTTPALVGAWIFYSSVTVMGQRFLTFQWDTLLLEVGFLAIFLLPIHLIPRFPPRAQPSVVVLWLFRWLAFRLMFISGLVKILSNDPVWLDLTALDFHFWTQPIPNPGAWFAHQVPGELKIIATGIMFFIELVIPFLFFAPRALRILGGLATIALMVGIMLTGNYTFFNLLTIVVAILLLDDGFFRAFFPRRLRERVRTAGQPRQRGLARNVANALLSIVLILALFPPGYFRVMATVTRSGSAVDSIANHLELVLPRDSEAFTRVGTPLRDQLVWTARLRIIGGYGLFANMTTRRPEIIIEGSSDGETWLPYAFRFKPGDPSRLPPQVAPHQPRLDWQMWFAALSDFERNPWFVEFVRRLLVNESVVLDLIAENPFPDEPPLFIRAVQYDYTFSDRSVRAATGDWWVRDNPELYLPAVCLADPPTAERPRLTTECEDLLSGEE